MNRFYECEGDVTTQLAPWETVRIGVRPTVSLFRIEKEIRFNSTIAGGDIVVPVGFLTDLASIPRAGWSIFADPDAPILDLGSIVHDWLYSHVGVIPVATPGVFGYHVVTLTRDQCDRVLAYEAMPECGSKAWQQFVVYYVLKFFGKGSFNTNPPSKRWGP